tara:strand:- start:479 stop:709 length:231 start_codon:yes stop_codon:yes gene_type:complete
MKQSPSLNKALIDEYTSRINETNTTIKVIYERLNATTSDKEIENYQIILNEQKDILSEIKERLASLKDYIEHSKKG